MKTLIIYHEIKPGTPCPDGIAAAWVAKRAIPDAEICGWRYELEYYPSPEEGDRLIVVDFSFPRTVMESWSQQGVELIVIDHHETAMNNLSSLSDRILAKFDMSECGATLTWKHFFPDEPMPFFLHHVKDRDLWDFLMEETEMVHEAMSFFRYKLRDADAIFKFFNGLAALSQESLYAFLRPIGEPLVAPKKAKVKEVAKRWEWLDLKMPDGEVYRIPIVRLQPDEDRLVSDVCMTLYRSIEAPFVGCITSGNDFSLRSDKHGNNFPVNTIALQFGGGGHRNAAGFRADQLINQTSD